MKNTIELDWLRLFVITKVTVATINLYTQKKGIKKIGDLNDVLDVIEISDMGKVIKLGDFVDVTELKKIHW